MTKTPDFTPWQPWRVATDDGTQTHFTTRDPLPLAGELVSGGHVKPGDGLTLVRAARVATMALLWARDEEGAYRGL